MEQSTSLITTAAAINLPQSLLLSQDKLSKALSSQDPEFVSQIFLRYQNGTSLAKSVSMNAPTFYTVTDFFGEQSTLFWLRYHIAETFAFVGIYDTASVYQIRHTAELIASHEVYGQFTLSEFLCFLQKFKLGEYGKIYQSQRPNPQEFLMCLKSFWVDISRERIRQEEQQRADELSRILKDPNNMTREEYEIIKQVTQEYDIFVEFNRGKYDK